MAISEAQTLFSGGGEAKEGVVPVMNGEDGFGVVGCHKSLIMNLKPNYPYSEGSPIDKKVFSI
jgi:hypothetical protein